MDELALRTLLNSLETSRSSLHELLHFFTGLVVVGLGFDLFVIIKEFRDNWKEFRHGQTHPYDVHLPNQPNVLLLILALAGTAQIVVGVAGELYVDVKAGKIETQIRQANDELLGLVIQKAGDAATSAKTAHEESDKATASAAYALGLANETIAIEEAHAWRQLSKRQISEIGQALKIHNRSAILTFPQGDTEAEVFAGQIRAALHEAEWRGLASSAQIEMHFTGPEPSPSQPIPNTPPLMGVFVWYKLEWGNPGSPNPHAAENELRGNAAGALAHELSRRGFDAVARPNVSPPMPPVSDILVEVGYRPKGPQGAAKLRQEKENKSPSKQANCE